MGNLFSLVEEEPEEGFMYELFEPELGGSLGYFPPESGTALKYWEERGVPTRIASW